MFPMSTTATIIAAEGVKKRAKKPCTDCLFYLPADNETPAQCMHPDVAFARCVILGIRNTNLPIASARADKCKGTLWKPKDESRMRRLRNWIRRVLAI